MSILDWFRTFCQLTAPTMNVNVVLEQDASLSSERCSAAAGSTKTLGGAMVGESRRRRRRLGKIHQ
jgi:hypothetical protein